MTLNEAIKHCEEVAEEKEAHARYFMEKHASKDSEKNKNFGEACEKCAEEHRQLAEWLRELRDYRENDLRKGTA